MSDEDFLRRTRAWLSTEKNFFVERLSKFRGLKIFPPTVNFVLLKLDTVAAAEKVLLDLRREKILLRSCANFAGLDGSYLRTAIRLRAENLKLLNALEKILEVSQ